MSKPEYQKLTKSDMIEKINECKYYSRETGVDIKNDIGNIVLQRAYQRIRKINSYLPIDSPYLPIDFALSSKRFSALLELKNPVNQKEDVSLTCDTAVDIINDTFRHFIDKDLVFANLSNDTLLSIIKAADKSITKAVISFYFYARPELQSGRINFEQDALILVVSKAKRQMVKQMQKDKELTDLLQQKESGEIDFD